MSDYTTKILNFTNFRKQKSAVNFNPTLKSK